MDKVKAFLDELTQLTRKYGIALGGCACCGSPYGYLLNPPEGSPPGQILVFEELEWQNDGYHAGLVE